MENLDPHGLGQYVSPAGLVGFFGSLLGILPAILGVIGGTVAIAWYSVQLWESATVQNWIKTRRARALARKVALLEFQQSQIVGELKQLGVLTHAQTDVKQGDMRKTTTTVETSTQPVQEASRD